MSPAGNLSASALLSLSPSPSPSGFFALLPNADITVFHKHVCVCLWIVGNHKIRWISHRKINNFLKGHKKAKASHRCHKPLSTQIAHIICTFFILVHILLPISIVVLARKKPIRIRCSCVCVDHKFLAKQLKLKWSRGRGRAQPSRSNKWQKRQKFAK